MHEYAQGLHMVNEVHVILETSLNVASLTSLGRMAKSESISALLICTAECDYETVSIPRCFHCTSQRKAFPSEAQDVGSLYDFARWRLIHENHRARNR